MTRRTAIFFLRWPVLALVCIAGCAPDGPPKQIDRAFYFWRSGTRPRASESDALNRLHARIVYLKFFDVEWDPEYSEVRPVAMLRLDSSFIPKSVEIIPVVFIKEDALARTEMRDIPQLARNIAGSLREMCGRLGRQINEIQFDCDWTLRTKDKYFLLIENTRTAYGQSGDSSKTPPLISATIRLHQVKYRERTGVPPVDRGMLMFYNMSDWRSTNTKNSIFDLDAASKYTDYIRDYPLPLDLALPIFRWTLAYRNGHFLTILNSIGGKELNSSPFVSYDGNNRYRVTVDTSIFNTRFMVGDVLRTEECASKDLFAAEKDVLPRIRNPNLRIALYHLDSASLSHYTYETLDSIFAGSP